MIWVWREGGQIPHGPFKSDDEARLYAEELARSYPGEAIWLHPATANVMVAAAEPIWDEGVPLSKVRPLAPGYAELLETQSEAPTTDWRISPFTLPLSKPQQLFNFFARFLRRRPHD